MGKQLDLPSLLETKYEIISPDGWTRTNSEYNDITNSDKPDFMKDTNIANFANRPNFMKETTVVLNKYSPKYTA